MPHPFLSVSFLDRMLDAELPAKRVYEYMLETYPAKVIGWVKDAKWRHKTVALAQIDMARRPGGRNMDKVRGIADKVKMGATMDPVVLVEVSPNRYEIADGYHRTLGYQHAGLKHIEAWVGSGDVAGFERDEVHAAKKNIEPGEKADLG